MKYIILDTWPDYKRLNRNIKTNMITEAFFKRDMVLSFNGRQNKSLSSNIEKLSKSLEIDAARVKR